MAARDAFWEERREAEREQRVGNWACEDWGGWMGGRWGLREMGAGGGRGGRGGEDGVGLMQLFFAP